MAFSFIGLPIVSRQDAKNAAFEIRPTPSDALFLALTLFHHLIDRFHNRDLHAWVADLPGVTSDSYTARQMTYDLRRLRLKGQLFRPPKKNLYFLTSYGWNVASLFDPLSPCSPARMPCIRFRSAHCSTAWTLQLDELIYQAFPQNRAS